MYNQEQIVDDIVMGDLVKQYPQLKKLIKTASPHEVRGGVLSVLDTDRKLHTDYKKYYELNKKCNYGTYTDEIVSILREYVKVADTEVKEHGEVMTPITLVEEMLDILPKEVWSNKDLKWLDPCNGVGTFPSVVVQRLMKGLEEVIPNAKKRYRHIIEEMIYVCEIQAKNMYIFHCVFDKQDIYELNTFYGSFLTKEFDEHMKNVWGVDKFDIIIGNPPYNQNIDLKFLKKAYDNSNIVLYVHPSVWVIDNKMKNKTFLDCRSYVKDRIKSLTLFNGNGVFGISLFYPCMITYITNQKTKTINVINRLSGNSYNTNNIDDIDLYDCDDVYLSIKSKIKEWLKININLWSMCKRDFNGTHTFNTLPYEVGFSPIRGDVKFRDKLDIGMDAEIFADSFYTFLQKKDIDKHIGERTNYTLKFGFTTIKEAENFVEYLKSKFARFCLSIYKNNQNFHGGELEIVPYLDFTQEWTDEKLYKEFNLTKEEINFINTHIPKYY